MSDQQPDSGDAYDMADSLGWELWNGARLARAYAEATKGDEEWGAFFQLVEREFDEMNVRVGESLRGASADAFRKRRPPWR